MAGRTTRRNASRSAGADTPHSTQPFTRATTIEIPETVSCVVVRGHDQTHGYGGTAALVTLDSQEQRIVDQGTEPQAFDTEDCP
ncbi:hypothetical protein [Halovenus salina]|uniref:Uncharacterized protein n=1 Tax=Halovenus salina TaxID=1510225 RepID=A0ABD5W0S1_9EURY